MSSQVKDVIMDGGVQIMESKMDVNPVNGTYQENLELNDQDKKHKMIHNRRKNGKRKYKCQDCGFTTRKVRQMQVHLRSHAPETPHQCDICHKTYNKLSVMKRHRLSHTAPLHYLCDLCGRAYTQLMSFKYHKLSHVKFLGEEGGTGRGMEGVEESKKKFLCDLCGKFFKQSMSLKVHRKWHERQQETLGDSQRKERSVLERRGRREKKCNEGRSVGSRKPLSCHICHKYFSKANTLKRHTMLHNSAKYRANVGGTMRDQDTKTRGDSGEKVSAAVPVICKANSSRPNNQTPSAKILRNIGKKRHHCEECPYSSQSFRDLQVHRRRHSGEKPYACTVCDKRFANQSVVRRHVATVHAEERAHTCTICGKGYTQASNLKMHKLTHYDITTGELIASDRNMAHNGKIVPKRGPKVETSEHVPDVKETSGANLESNTTLLSISEGNECKTEVLDDHVDCDDFDEKDDVKNIISAELSDSIVRENEAQVMDLKVEIKDEPLDVSLEFDESDNLPLIYQKHDTEALKDDMEIKLLKKQRKEEKKKRKDLKRQQKLNREKQRNSNVLQCDQCHYTVSKRRDLERHMRSHSKERPYQCDVCHRHFSDQSVVKRHKLIHLGIKSFACHFCDKKFSQSTGLKAHLIQHTGAPPPLPYVCDMCGKTFSQEKSLKAHRHVHYRGSYSPQYVCPHCGRAFSFLCRLKEHQLSHTGDKTVQCDLCEKKFLRIKDMRSHRTVHTREQKSICDKCGKFFATPKTLRLHTQCHSQVKPFVCDVCGATFTRQSHLTRHATTHSGTKTLECNICSILFTHHSALSRHKALHSRESPFSCGGCSKSFQMLDNLKKHMKRTKHNITDSSLLIEDICKSSDNNTLSQEQPTDIQAGTLSKIKPLQALPNG